MKDKSEENCGLLCTMHKKQVSPLVTLMEYRKLILEPKFKLKREGGGYGIEAAEESHFQQVWKKSHDGNLVYFLNIPCSVVKTKPQL